jgi:hypothetical protein
MPSVPRLISIGGPLTASTARLAPRDDRHAPLSPDQVADALRIRADELRGDARLSSDGANRLVDPPPDPAWKAFTRQFNDILIRVLRRAR